MSYCATKKKTLVVLKYPPFKRILLQKKIRRDNYAVANKVVFFVVYLVSPLVGIR